jgi:hypothetical protein
MRTRMSWSRWLALTVVALAWALSPAGCVSAAQPEEAGAPGQTQAQAEATSEQDEVVCRHETPTGSNIPQRVCYQRRDADERREQDQRLLQDSHRWDTAPPSGDGPR